MSTDFVIPTEAEESQNADHADLYDSVIANEVRQSSYLLGSLRKEGTRDDEHFSSHRLRRYSQIFVIPTNVEESQSADHADLYDSVIANEVRQSPYLLGLLRVSPKL